MTAKAPAAAGTGDGWARDGTGDALLAAVTATLAAVMRSAGELGDAMTSLAAASPLGRPVRPAGLAPLRPLASAVLRRHRDLVAGAGVVLAPGVVAGAPRWIQWWWRAGNGAIRPLDVDLDPGSAEFYDYTANEWYRVPARTGRPWVTGPYVDYICTHEYTYTLSSPMFLAGRFLGVAGADILADRVEQLVLPELARLGPAAVLVSGHGRVIASNSASIRPGTVLAAGNGSALLPPAAASGAPLAGDGGPVLPWAVAQAHPGALADEVPYNG